MGLRSQTYAALMTRVNLPWYELDAQFVWVPGSDTDTTTIDPIVGGQYAQKSASPAVYSSPYWDMTGSVYSTTTALASTVDLSRPFLFATVVDKNNQASSSARLIIFGSEATDAVSFGTGSSATTPVFRIYMSGAALGGVTFPSQSSWSAKGTAVVHWVDYDPSDPTNTVLAGYNSTITTSSGVLTVPTGRTLGRTGYTGNTSGTSSLSAIKTGITEFVSRAGMTRSDKAAIVAKIKAQAGI